MGTVLFLSVVIRCLAIVAVEQPACPAPDRDGDHSSRAGAAGTGPEAIRCSAMTPVIVALFDDYGIAERVRTELVADGIPTDRVELTSLLETGQADAEPGDAFAARVANYFHTLLDQDGRRNGDAEELARRVRAGNSAITVHPRLEYEFDSVRQILHRNKPVAVEEIL